MVKMVFAKRKTQLVRFLISVMSTLVFFSSLFHWSLIHSYRCCTDEQFDICDEQCNAKHNVEICSKECNNSPLKPGNCQDHCESKLRDCKYYCCKDATKSCPAVTDLTVSQQETVSGWVVHERAKKRTPLKFGKNRRAHYRNIVKFDRANNETNIATYQIFVSQGKNQDFVLVREFPVTPERKRYKVRQRIRDPYITYHYTVKSVDQSGEVLGTASAKIKGLRKRFP